MNIIARGRIYHSIFSEVWDFWCALISGSKSTKAVAQIAHLFKQNLGMEYCLIFPYARSAIYHVLKHQKFPHGSEIIMPPITIKPMVDVVLQVGLKPVFVDLEKNTYCFNADELSRNINKNTKAILVTYLFGLAPDMGKIVSIVKKKGLFMIEDFSQALNAEYGNKKLGTFGDCSVYSSSSLKTMDTYGGGFFLTNDKGLYESMAKVIDGFGQAGRLHLTMKIIVNFLRNFSTHPVVFSFITFRLLNLVKKINYTMYQKLTGARLNLLKNMSYLSEWSWKYTDVQARRGMKIFNRIKSDDLVRIENVDILKKHLDRSLHGRLPIEFKNSRNVYWQIPFIVDDFAAFQHFMGDAGVDVGRTNLSLCSELEAYKEYSVNTPVAKLIKNQAVFLPTYPKLSDKNIKKIARLVNHYYQSGLSQQEAR